MTDRNRSVADRGLLMERLWDDLSRRPKDIPSPDWHGEILAEREAAVGEGRMSLIEWGVAKERLRERLK